MHIYLHLVGSLRDCSTLFRYCTWNAGAVFEITFQKGWITILRKWVGCSLSTLLLITRFSSLQENYFWQLTSYLSQFPAMYVCMITHFE